MLQFVVILGGLCQLFASLLEDGSNLLKGLAFGLRDSKISKHSKGEKQHSKQDEHVNTQPRLKKSKRETSQEAKCLI